MLARVGDNRRPRARGDAAHRVREHHIEELYFINHTLHPHRKHFVSSPPTSRHGRGGGRVALAASTASGG